MDKATKHHLDTLDRLGMDKGLGYSQRFFLQIVSSFVCHYEGEVLNEEFFETIYNEIKETSTAPF